MEKQKTRFLVIECTPFAKKAKKSSCKDLLLVFFFFLCVQHTVSKGVLQSLLREDSLMNVDLEGEGSSGVWVLQGVDYPHHPKVLYILPTITRLFLRYKRLNKIEPKHKQE